MEKLLIRGIDTLIGSNLALALSDRVEVVGLASDSSFQLAGGKSIACDLDNSDETSYHVLAEAPALTIYCGPLSAASWDFLPESQPDGEHEGRLAKAFAHAAAKAQSACVIVTTDALFAGPRMFHAETSRRTADHHVAQAASACEQAVAESAALIVRTHAYGWSPAGAASCFAERVSEQLASGAICHVDAQNHATPILASDLAELIWRATQAGLTGVYHATGAERTSQYRFAAELAAALGLTGRQTQLETSTRLDQRPFVVETSLNTRALRRALELPLPMLRDGLYKFAEQSATWRSTLQNASRKHAAVQAA